MPSPTEFAPHKEQAPCPRNSAQLTPEMRGFISAARHLRRERRDRLEASACRKRAAALMSGRFRGADGWTDEEALDAFAPHPRDDLEPRVFTPEMERAELAAWSRIDAAKHEGRAPYRDACRAYLRFVEGAERAAASALRLEPIKAFAGMTGRPRLKGALQLRAGQ
jgi:hypothetical protein